MLGLNWLPWACSQLASSRVSFIMWKYLWKDAAQVWCLCGLLLWGLATNIMCCTRQVTCREKSTIDNDYLLLFIYPLPWIHMNVVEFTLLVLVAGQVSCLQNKKNSLDKDEGVVRQIKALDRVWISHFFLTWSCIQLLNTGKLTLRRTNKR